MRKERKDAILAYEKIYGKTSPLSKIILMGYKPSYLGCKISDGNIVFVFSSKMSHQDMSDIEDVFRNRLGRKFSFMLSEQEFTVLVNPMDKEELGEYFIAAQVIDRYYKGIPQGAQQMAEYGAYQAGEDWRDESVVAKYLQQLAKK